MAADSQSVVLGDRIPWDKYDRFVLIHAGSDLQTDVLQDSARGHSDLHARRGGHRRGVDARHTDGARFVSGRSRDVRARDREPGWLLRHAQRRAGARVRTSVLRIRGRLQHRDRHSGGRLLEPDGQRQSGGRDRADGAQRRNLRDRSPAAQHRSVPAPIHRQRPAFSRDRLRRHDHHSERRAKSRHAARHPVRATNICCSRIATCRQPRRYSSIRIRPRT